MPPLKLTLVVAIALIDPDNRILLAQRPEGKQLAGLWEFPGGKVEPGERPEETLIRELREELGITVKEPCLAPLTFASYPYETFHLLMPLYICRRWDGFVQPLEGQALKWVKPQELRNYPMPPADEPLIPSSSIFSDPETSMSSQNAGAIASTPAPTAAFVVSNLLICSFLWGSSFLLVKLSGNLSPFVLAAMRGLIGATTLALWFTFQGKSILPQLHELRIWAVLGTFNGWLPNVLLAYALTQIPTAPAGMIQASSPLIVAVLSHLLFADERLTPQRFVGVVVGFLGMGILIGPAALPDSGINATGVLVMIAVACSYATANIYVRTVRKADPARMALGQQICSGFAATLLALIMIGPEGFAPVPSRLVPLLTLGALSTALPILLFMHLIRRTGPTRASMVGYLAPVWTTIMAVLFLDESIGLRELIGGAVVLMGVALVSLSGRLKPIR